MTNFKDFKQALQNNIDKLLQDNEALYLVNVSKDDLWNLYQDSFSDGYNEVFRERREYECSNCRSFFTEFARVVVIDNNKVKSIWRDVSIEYPFNMVAEALANYIESCDIQDRFITSNNTFGTDSNKELLGDGTIVTWNHFYYKLPKQFVYTGRETVDTVKSNHRSNKETLQRSFEQISASALETVIELIEDNNLYRGSEWLKILKEFQALHTKYFKLKEEYRDAFLWANSSNPVISKIKNHSIGTLLINLTGGMDINEAVRKYEVVVAPANYKRSKAIFTESQKKAAEKFVIENGYMDSLYRRFANLNDISITDLLWANKETSEFLTNSPFQQLTPKKVSNNFDNAQPISVEDFLAEIMPRSTKIEAYVDNSHVNNFVSLIAPQIIGSKPLFKWNNNFSWVYNNNLTSSDIKSNVSKFGGKVDGVMRFSIQWNDDNRNHNDEDAHCITPNGNEIYYANKFDRITGGNLDIDIIHPNGVAVENITFPNWSNLRSGNYRFYVNTFNYRGGKGYKAQFECNGETLDFDIPTPSERKQLVISVNVDTQKRTFEVVYSLNGTKASQEVWNITTQNFQTVKAITLSPNYWDNNEVGTKHYLFMLENCVNPDTPSGFFNEYLKDELYRNHRQVFEMLKERMRVAPTTNQLSGLGFNSTQRNSLIIKTDNYSRLLKVEF